jgi:hypothetical protein
MGLWRRGEEEPGNKPGGRTSEAAEVQQMKDAAAPVTNPAEDEAQKITRVNGAVAFTFNAQEAARAALLIFYQVHRGMLGKEHRAIAEAVEVLEALASDGSDAELGPTKAELVENIEALLDVAKEIRPAGVPSVKYAGTVYNAKEAARSFYMRAR